MLENYEGVLKVDGEIGNKKVCDPRSYLKAGEQSMSRELVKHATIFYQWIKLSFHKYKYL